MKLVQKYGGTSVGSVELIRRVAARVHALRDAGNAVAVVVSAMGDSTDRLLDMARAIAPDPDLRELDQLLATGEQVSIALLAMALRERGCPSRSYCGFQLPIRTTDVHGRARIESIDGARLEADLAAGVVPVVAGFQGLDPHGDVTTIGRGGSDTTAVAVAVALRADECQILTDVDGVYTTDPRMVPDARRLDRLTFDEMLELAGQGSRVLHLRSVEFASKYGVRLRVLSSFRPDGPGTLITSEEEDVEAPVVSGIAFNRDEAQITVRGVPDAPGVAFRLLHRRVGEDLEWLARDEVHREDAPRGEVVVHARDGKPRLPGEQPAEPREVARLGEIVGLLVELALRLRHHAADIEVERQQPGHAQQRRDVVHVAVDGARHAGVLHLEREVAAVDGARAMHLADGGGRDRLVVERGEAALPAVPPLAAEHATQLRERHGVRIGAQDGERLRHFRRQQVVAFEREDLPELHRRAAQVRQALGEPRRGAGGQRNEAVGVAAAQALRDHARDHFAGHHAERQEAREPAFGNGGAADGFLAGHDVSVRAGPRSAARALTRRRTRRKRAPPRPRT